jgi:hypothetical protein
VRNGNGKKEKGQEKRKGIVQKRDGRKWLRNG